VSLDSSTLHTEAFDVSTLRDQLQAGPALEPCKAAIAHYNNWSHNRFTEGDPIHGLITLRAKFMDSLLGELWQMQCWDNESMALIAVGGYGRGELHPCSDIDLLILLGENSDSCKPKLEQFLTLLWDIGLDIGHSVRTLQECVEEARDNITVVTNMMEARLIQGSASLLSEMRAATSAKHMWDSAAFYQGKIREQSARHQKFADTEYNLEPNIKSSPGGLRDLQIIIWLAERHFGHISLKQLYRERFLTKAEIRTLLRGRDFMWRVRYALHMITGREEDRLLFDHQRKLADMWGFTDGRRLAVEKFMKLYYRRALSLGQLNELLIQNFAQVILARKQGENITLLNDRFQVRSGYLETRSDRMFSEHPTAMLEAFQLCGNNPTINGIAAPTIRLIRDHLHLIDDNFRQDPVNQRMFMDILRAPHKMTAQLRRMRRYGILGQYLPEFGRIIGQMQHDLFHAYTVDAHTLEVVKNMRRFMTPEFDEKFPVTSRVARRLDKKELLYVAGLYHDIGKGRGGDHSQLGAVDAELFCQRHGLSNQDTKLVVWLVQHHLVMSGVAQRKDISDPEVIQEFATLVQNRRRLDFLLTLTVADINGTNPTLWNAWRAALLRQLYTETKRALRRGLENPVDKQEWIHETQNAAIHLLEYRGFDRDEVEALWGSAGEDYFLREKAEDIAWHIEAIARHYDKDQPLVLVRNTVDSNVANATQIFIHAKNRPHMFSTICSGLEQLDLSVHDARIYGSISGMTLDTFYVLGSDGESITHDTLRLENISDQLSQILADSNQQQGISRRRTPRQVKAFSVPTVTHMSLDESKNQTVLEVSSPDRPGLLARIGKLFMRFNVELQTAKIQTLGERVEDVFYITDQNMNPITDEQLQKDIQQAICAELDEQAAA